MGGLNGLDLFSGIGGISLALEPWVRTTAYCEIDPYCQRVLNSRMRDGSIERAPVWDDVKTLTGREIGPVDLISGGFPCQDISLAGKRAGLDGERSGLYREILRLVSECKPSYVFLENVAAIRSHAWRVVADLATLGYDCRWTSLSAAQVGAPHKRDRWWLLAANTISVSIRVESWRSSWPNRQVAPIARNDVEAKRLVKPRVWNAEYGICRAVDGVPYRVDRLRALGNSVVPLQARTAFKYLGGLA